MSILEGTQFRVRDVWNHNAGKEFEVIKLLSHKYPIIAVDTEFPGSFKLEKPAVEGLSEKEHKYQILKANVDGMKLIQVGFTLTNERGELPMIGGVCCAAWQFNLRDFDPEKDLQVESSIQLLRSSHIDFERNLREGIDSRRFGSLLMTHNFLFNRKVHYVCYQGQYDFAYLLKAVRGGCMPCTEAEFEEQKLALFGTVYDVRDVQREHFEVYIGLQQFADNLGVQRMSGVAHQAGSDSLLSLSYNETDIRGSSSRT